MQVRRSATLWQSYNLGANPYQTIGEGESSLDMVTLIGNECQYDYETR